ncbi:ABC transporter permease [Chenggangzhangella methanolivorans]|uniref:ABC transporter permease n=1 Tax=Chenggangzhangella methanolivorans TaxID=1437009 RepID=A0A9E6UNK3_9HYPH|nr:ABC transporter permease [Chenggangzhangella methanolivorans]QZO00304.1 ABC transporter permease [Chenggangzhangella methanolivorans]
MDLLLNILLGVTVAATPLVFAAIGELVTEKSGVLNLGVEGMMIMGAIAAFAGTVGTGSYVAGILIGALAGAAMGGLFGVLTLTLMSNQVACGLALTLFGLGLSALIGQSYSGISLPQFPRVDIPLLTDIPFLGPLIFGQDALVYLSLALVAGVAWFLARTRPGLILRAVGENHEAAHGIGYPVIRIRYLAVMFGGACAGLGGAYLSLVQTPLWVEKMSAGRGWIALALVVFASWRPLRVLGGAYLFGGITIMQLHSQALGLQVDAQILSMMPYLATILVLVVISRDRVKMKLNAPSCLGKVFYATS